MALSSGDTMLAAVQELQSTGKHEEVGLQGMKALQSFMKRFLVSDGMMRLLSNTSAAYILSVHRLATSHGKFQFSGLGPLTHS